MFFSYLIVFKFIGTSNHEIRYAIIGGNTQENFTIDMMTGEIRIKGALDFESIYQRGDSRFFNLTVKVISM